jgi:hypothetical protein
MTHWILVFDTCRQNTVSLLAAFAFLKQQRGDLIQLADPSRNVACGLKVIGVPNAAKAPDDTLQPTRSIALIKNVCGKAD